MDTSKLSDREKAIRRTIRAFLLTATLAELRKEKAISLELGDSFRAVCIQELIEETEA